MKEEFTVKKLRAEVAVAEKALWDALTNLRKRVEALEQVKQKQKPDPNPSDIQEDQGMDEDPINESLVPGPEDVGRWVMVRDGREPEKGPYILRDVEASSHAEYPFSARYSTWKHARIVPGPIRGTLQEHDGTGRAPESLSVDDYVIIEEIDSSGELLLFHVREVEWGIVTRYQKTEIK